MKKEYYKQLIIKQLSEGLTPEQEGELQEWLKADSANEGVQTNLAKAWQHSDLYKATIEVNVQSGWKKVSKQLPNQRKIVSIWRKPLSVAAAVLLLLTIGWLLSLNFSAEALQFATNKGETKVINLPDGSIVTLNENSSLAYTTEEKQRVAILAGEAFFEVSHDVNNPFSVESNGTRTTVLGTKFNVDASNISETRVSLMEGKVSFEASNHDKVILAPGEEVLYYNQLDSLVQEKKLDENAIAWKSKVLKFENEKITKVIQIIEKYFDKQVDLILDNEECRFTGSFTDPKYQEVIEVLKFTYELDYKPGKTKDQIHIHKCK